MPSNRFPIIESHEDSIFTLPSGIVSKSSPVNMTAPQPKSKAIYIPLSKRHTIQLADSEVSEDDDALDTISIPSLSLSSSPVHSSASSVLLSPTSRGSSLPTSAVQSDEEDDSFEFDDVLAAPQSKRIYSAFELLKLGEDFKSSHFSLLNDRIAKHLEQQAPWIYIHTAQVDSDRESSSSSGSKRSKKTGGNGKKESAAAAGATANTNATSKNKRKGNSKKTSGTGEPQTPPSQLPHSLPKKPSPRPFHPAASAPLATTAHTPSSAHALRGPALPPTTDVRRKKPSQFTRISGRADEVADWFTRKDAKGGAVAARA